MRYVLMDWNCGDCFTEEFDSKEVAIESGEIAWNHLTYEDQKRRESFYLIESANPDEESENHLDGDIVKSWK